MINLNLVGIPAKIAADLSSNQTGNPAEQAALAARLAEIQSDMNAATSAPNTFNGVQVRVAINIPSTGQIQKMHSVTGLSLAI